MNLLEIDTTKTTKCLYIRRLTILTSALYNAHEDEADSIADGNMDAANEARGRFIGIHAMIRNLVQNNS